MCVFELLYVNPVGIIKKPINNAFVQSTVTMTSYEVLGLEKFATDTMVKKKYRELVLKYHPDRPNGNATKFAEIKATYEKLLNGETGQAVNDYSTADTVQEKTILYRSISNKPSVNGTLRFGITMTLHEAMNTDTIKLDYMRYVICTKCIAMRWDCHACGGKGSIFSKKKFGFIKQFKKCSMCNGNGFLCVDCKRCGGVGFEMERK